MPKMTNDDRSFLNKIYIYQYYILKWSQEVYHSGERIEVSLPEQVSGDKVHYLTVQLPDEQLFFINIFK